MRRLPAPFVLLALVSGCDPEIIVTRTEVVMNLPPGTCGATMRPTTLNLTALGDFPPGEGTLAFSRLDMGDPLPIDDFPFETEALVLRVQNTLGELWESVRPLTGDPSVATLLLPPGRSCDVDVNDRDVELPDGAAVAPTVHGGFVIVGGLERSLYGDDDTNNAIRRIVYVPADGRFSTVHSLSVPRAFATATRVGDYIVVAGGVELDEGVASESFEVLDARTGEPVREAAPMCARQPCVGERRRDHGAAALPDGRVLIVGGVEQVTWERSGSDVTELVTAPSASMISIDPATGEVDEDYGELTDQRGMVEPRRAPQVVALDDGAVVITGGFDPTGFPRGDAFHVGVGESTPIFAGTFGAFSGRFDATAVALPGARLAWVGGTLDPESEPIRVPVRHITILHLENGPVGAPDVDVFLPGYAGMLNCRAIALEDGRIFATGGAGEAFFIDVGRGIAVPLEVLRDPPRALMRLEDGTIVELRGGDVVSSFRRQLSPPRTRWDSPPGLGTLTLEDEEWLAIDAESHVDLLTGSATPGMTARVDVASAVFRDVAVTVIASGQVDLIFQEERGPAFTRVGVTPNQASVSGVCDLDMPCAEHVRIERRGAELVLVCPDTGAVKGCAAFADPAAGLRVALRLYDDSRLEGITIERL